MIEIGDRVMTKESSEAIVNWSKDVRARRRWNVEGVVCVVHGAHGLICEVKHDDDGSFGFYHRSELVPIVAKLDLKGYREQRIKELLEDWIERERDPDTLLQMAFDAAVDRIKQQYINQYEKLLKALRKEVEYDTPTGEFFGVRALLRDFQLKWDTGFEGWQDGAEIEYRAALLESPHDLRAAGWVVAVHNDYKFSGKPMTFWLLTKQVPGSQFPLCLKGEGATDREALDQIRQHAFAKEEVADGTRSKQIPGEQEGDQSAGVIIRND
jgi:hypothetical protein